MYADLQGGGQRRHDGGGQRLQAVDVAHDPDDARKLERPAHHLRRTGANLTSASVLEVEDCRTEDPSQGTSHPHQDAV